MNLFENRITPTNSKIMSIVLISLTIALFTQLSNITYHSDIKDYFHKNEKALIDYKAIESNYNNQNSLLLIVSVNPGTTKDTLLNRQNIQQLSEILRVINAYKGVDNVFSILDTTVNLNTIDGEKNLSLKHYLDTKIYHNKANDTAIFSQLSDNLIGSSFWLSSDCLTTVIEVTFHNNAIQQKSYHALLSHISSKGITHNENNNSTYNDAPRLPNDNLLHIDASGPIAIKAELNQTLLHDGIYLFPIILLTGVILLYLFIGSIKLIAAGIVTIIIALSLTIEFSGLLSAQLNQTSVLAFGIVFIISLADVIHVLMCYQAQAELGRTPSIHQAVRQKLFPLCLTSLTTCIGFLSLHFANSPTFSTFGFIAATGVVLALVATVTLLPTIVDILHRNRPAEHTIKINNKAPTLLKTFITSATNYSLQHPYAPLIIVMALTLFLFVGLARNTFHNNSLTYFSESSTIHQATRQFESAFDTHQGIAVMLTLSGTESIYSPETAQNIDRFHQWLTQQPWAKIHFSYVNTLMNIHRGLHENDFRWQRLPKDPRLIAELFNLYEMASKKNTPALLGINNQAGSILVSIGIPEVLNRDVLLIQRDIEHWFNQNAPSVKATVSGQAILFANVGWNLTLNMLLGALLTMSVITLLIGVTFRNARLALLSTIPNILPALVCLGMVGWLSGKINFAIAGSISMALGIVVDDTIHILSEYRRLRINGINAHESIRMTLIETGPALLLTTLVLSVGFSILNLASFVPNQQTAQMITAMISSAIIFDFIILPYLLVFFDRWIFSSSVHSNSINQYHKKTSPMEQTSLP